MRIRNIVIIVFIFLIFYFTVGFNFAEFYFGGKDAILNAGEKINKLCNDNGACPQEINGWQEKGQGRLGKDKMLYLIPISNSNKNSENNIKPQTFRIVYTMTIPDNWFEVQGGVGKQVTSSWKSR